MLDQRLLHEAIKSPIAHRMLNAALTVRLLQRITAHDPAAGADLFARDPEASLAAARAEADELTPDEQRQLIGDFPERVGEYNAAAWMLVNEALCIIDLPTEVVDTISGDMIALYAAALMANDVRAARADAQEDDEAQAA